MRKISLLLILLWALYCPQRHLIYFTEKNFQDCDLVCASDFFVENRGYLPKGIYQPIWWNKPFANQEAKCPIDGKVLRFEKKYLKEIN